MDEWGWKQLSPWLTARAELPVGPLFGILDGPTRGRPWSGAAVRSEFRRLATQAGVRRRLGHANHGTSSIYLQGIDPEEIIMAVHTRRAPMMSASAGRRL